MEETQPLTPYQLWLTDPGRMEYRNLQQSEAFFMPGEKFYEKPSYIRARKRAVRTIEELAQGCDDALIPYMAMTYYDRLILKIEIDQVLVGCPIRENPPLFVMCCLTISWKLRTRNFNLVEFMKARKLEYSPDEVLDMEFHICRRLQWRLRTLTPFCFVEYMIPLLGKKPVSPRRPVRQLIVRTQYDASFLEYSPSILAAAAMLVVSKGLFPRRQHDIFEFQVLTSEFVSPHMVRN
ncbi:putative cyclin-D6-1 [Andrographis paniculata]|uniref:putative cyclin-D6-1 n=1 Tax=Andrographis paniculata TaxID=175694 RepID=UPI0021E75141|nr:putative cyclin-D6-1 [Andrographis paniculata]